MADEHWQLEKEYYTITAPHDLVLRVVEHKKLSDQQGDTKVVRTVPTKVHEFRVDLDTLAEASPHFSGLLESRPEVVEIQEDDAGNVIGLLAWLKIIHYVVTKDMYHLHLYEVWHVCLIAKKYGFDTYAEKAREWFNDWWNAQPGIKHFTFREYEQLLLPCTTFDHAPGFAQTSKYLAYRSNGPIAEAQPGDFRPDPVAGIATHPAVMIQINAARSRLITVLHRALYAPINALLKENNCNCAPFILYAYQRGLTDTGCWPLHPALDKMSVKAALEDLSRFVNMPMQTCHKDKCNLDLLAIVEKAIKDLEGQFAGLCLDCMMTSSYDVGTEECAAYWYHEIFGVAWDEGCRISHTQPSWFFSFMGNRADMNNYLLGKTRERSSNQHGQSSYGYGNSAFQRGGLHSNRGPRQETRNSNRPGRQDSLFSRPFYPSHAIEGVTDQLANTGISEG